MPNKNRLTTTIAMGAVIASLLLMPLFSQSKVGTTGVPFLGIHVGPRAYAMGGAFTAMSDDATSLYYNPGGSHASPSPSFSPRRRTGWWARASTGLGARSTSAARTPWDFR